MDIDYAASIRPTKRQINIQELEFYGFIHFGMNTIYDTEWGNGREDVKKFNPEDVDTDEWIKSLKSAGMKGAILTCKHHDGFCLWPSKYTNHTVAASPWKEGEGDLVAEFAASCRKYDLKFGIYLSPWDMYEETYGMGKAYDDFYVNQLKELLTNYGPVFSVWLDGANGEGPNGKVQEYDWKRYYQTVRELQPNAVISVSGPDVRWVGNEAGKTRKNEWSVVPAYMKDPAVTAGLSQQEDSTAFRETFTTGDEDLGSRDRLQQYEGELIWYPAEVDLSIRPGWFYHDFEDDKVRTAENLFEVYKTSVGKNATLLLNVPPMPSGRLHQQDKEVLKSLGHKITVLNNNNFITDAHVTFSSAREKVLLTDLTDPHLNHSYWQSVEGDLKPWIEVRWREKVTADTLILGEYIPNGQLIEDCKISIQSENGRWHEITTIQSIGYKRIINFLKQDIIGVRILIEKYRAQPNLNYISVNTQEN